eukprot:gnl/TRDRNA2_/TRDRNA2_169032_c0_seq2.p1 gnl/TRDRNA2_/TRDRNA2_169032_c0~~gnl/TRDRNA2_/TRDRNA2_169032_c0_seq2.p1  ORF type:complete len:258 (+),score=40.52 gnl/TRDRNA2_/TRDRNA2_169032_c0_seq2:28-801(+)
MAAVSPGKSAPWARPTWHPPSPLQSKPELSFSSGSGSAAAAVAAISVADENSRLWQLASRETQDLRAAAQRLEEDQIRLRIAQVEMNTLQLQAASVRRARRELQLVLLRCLLHWHLCAHISRAAQFHASQRAQCDGTWRLVSILQQSMYRITSSAWHHWHRNVTLPPAPKRDTATLLAISEVEALQARLEAAEARAERCANELETVKRATPLIPATAPCKDCQRYAQECLEAQAELEAYRDVVLTHVAKGHQFALPS